MICIGVFHDDRFVNEITFDSFFQRENDELLSDCGAFIRCSAIFVVEDTAIFADSCSGRQYVVHIEPLVSFLRH